MIALVAMLGFGLCGRAQAQHATIVIGPAFCNNAGLMNMVVGSPGSMSTYPTTTNYPGHSMTIIMEAETVTQNNCTYGSPQNNGTLCAAPVVAMNANAQTGVTISKSGLFIGYKTYKLWPYVDGVQFGDPKEQTANLCPEPIQCPPQGCPSPVLIPLRAFNRGNQVKLSDAAHGVVFDIRGKGVQEKVAWPVDAADVGFLGIDKNHNGVIDDATELVGSALLEGSSSGWGALARLAGSPMPEVKPGMPLFDSLVMWIDRNRDGISTPDEVEPASHYLAAVGLGGEWVGKKDRYGNTYKWQGYVVYADAPTQKRPAYDVYFVTLPQ